MASRISAIHDAPRDRVLAYLAERGIDPAVAGWKYFDASFNRDRCRGLVWLRDGEIRAFLGLIPCSVTDGATSWPMTWTCDWSVADRGVDGALGVLLVKKAMAVAPWLLAFGGNDTTQALLPKVAAATIEGAGVTYRLSLRLGTLTRRLERRVPLLARRRVSHHLHRIPIRRVPRHAHGVSCTAGIDPAIEAVTAATPSGALIPRYDAQHLAWQLGRCPTVTCWTLLAAAGGAGAVVWRSRHSPVEWRLALWPGTRPAASLDAVVRAASRLAYDGGGEVVSTVVSRLDRDLIERLEAARFERVGKARPLFVCGRPAEAPGSLELAGLSYLATDLGYRFSTAGRQSAPDGPLP